MAQWKGDRRKIWVDVVGGCSNGLGLFKKKKKKKKNPSNCMFNFQLDPLAGLTCSVAAQLLALGLC